MKAPTLKGPYKCFASIDLALSQKEAWALIKHFQTIPSWCAIFSYDDRMSNRQDGMGAKRRCKVQGLGNIHDQITFWQSEYGYVYQSSAIKGCQNLETSWWLTFLTPHLTRLNLELSYQVNPALVSRLHHFFILRKKLIALLPNILGSLSTPLFSDNKCTFLMPYNSYSSN